MYSICVVATFTVIILRLLSCWLAIYSNINIIVSNIKIIKGSSIILKYLKKFSVLLDITKSQNKSQLPT